MKGSYLVVGGSGGIGAAIVERLCQDVEVDRVIATRHTGSESATHEKLQFHELDITDEASVAALMSDIGDIDGVINCIGFLHDETMGPEKSVSQLSFEKLSRNIMLNTWPTMLMAKYARRNLRKSKFSVFVTLSARVGSIEDNRLGGWYSYRASKAALNMFVRSLAIEWQRALPFCSVAALHPGTVATPLSDPFSKNVLPEKLFTPEQSADYLLRVISLLEPETSGRFLAWDGSEIPW